MNSELEKLRKEMTREEFIRHIMSDYNEPLACPKSYKLLDTCGETRLCVKCWKSAVKDIKFKDDIAIQEVISNGHKEELSTIENCERYQIHKELCENIQDIYKSKNKDYGNSFAKRRKDYGNVAILIRLEDKFERLKHLMTSTDIEVKSETVEDTLTDLANYCLLELVERKLEQEGEKIG